MPRAARLIKHFVGRVKQQVSLCVRGCSRQAGRQRAAAALGFQLFETDMGELFFSGLTPNLPLMDGPPNSALLQAHSGAACKQRQSPVAPLFGREMDQPTVCQGPLSGSPPQSAARIPKTTALEWWIPTGCMRCFTNPGALHRFQNVAAARQKGTEFPSLCARTGRPTVGKNKTAPSLKGRVPRKKKIGGEG